MPCSVIGKPMHDELQLWEQELVTRLQLAGIHPVRIVFRRLLCKDGRIFEPSVYGWREPDLQPKPITWDEFLRIGNAKFIIKACADFMELS